MNSSKIAKDLLDKRSAIYSDRPLSIMAGQLVGFTKGFALQHYGEKWRKQRRMVSRSFNLSTVPNYYGMQEREAATLNFNLLNDPSTLYSEVPLRIRVNIIRILYGYPVHSAADQILGDIMETMKIFNQTTNPGNFLVDSFPSLRYMPRWMPGSGFLDQADAWRARLDHTVRNPYAWCRTNLDTGKTLMPNLCGTIVQEAGGNLSAEEEEDLLWASVAMMGGGLDTSSSAILSFLKAMVLHPDVQKKAHAELDAVVGTDRLPLMSDRAELPYIRSIVAEVLRWAPPGPLGVPHALNEDDVYEGYYFTKGTIVLSNIWHMLRDPEIYPSPAEFRPERFNGDDTEMAKVFDLAFGFGRRACPRRNFADGTLFATMATVLATCHILPELNALGEVVLPKYAYTNGVVSFPERFSLRMKPRSAQAVTLLSDALPVSD